MTKEQVRELFAAAVAQVSQGERDAVVAELLQAMFDRHKADGTVTALVGALLDSQAIVLVTIDQGGGLLAEYSLHEGCSPASADFVANTMRAISVVADSVLEDVDDAHAADIGGAG